MRRALERVGEQIAGILKRAHETAAEITTQSRREAEDRLEVARQEAAGIVAAAQSRVKELDGDTDRIWVERQRIVDDVRGLSEELLALAQAAAERFPPGDEPAAPASEALEPAGPERPAEPEGAAEPEGVLEPEEAAEPEGAVEPEGGGEPARAAEPEDHAEPDPSDTEATAVMPTIEELEVEPPPVPPFGNDREEDK